MAESRTDYKRSRGYLDKFRETRKIGSYNFELDLRHIKNDSQLTKAQKTRIRRVHNDYSEIMDYHGKGAMKLIRPRKHKGESEKQYNKRFKTIQKNETNLKYLDVIPLGVPAKSKYKIVDNQIIISRPNTDLSEYHYPLSIDNFLDFIKSPADIIDGVIATHNKKHPKAPAILVGLGSDGYPWKIMGVHSVDEIAAAFEKMHGQYIAAGDKGITISHIIIRSE
jgi:hypothetical protein